MTKIERQPRRKPKSRPFGRAGLGMAERRCLAGEGPVRGEKTGKYPTDENYLGLIQFACALYWYRRLVRLGQSIANQNPT
jgi:hypothetical protein